MNDSEKLDNLNVETSRRVIKEVLSYVGLTGPKFAESIGVGYQRVFDLMRGRTKKFNPSIVEQICKKYPNISRSYLYTGVGSLTVDGNADEKVSVQQSQSDEQNIQPSDSTETFNQLIVMLKQLNERSAYLTEFERKLNEREALLNARELDLDKREEELGISKKVG